jgi:hypothetical protein
LTASERKYILIFVTDSEKTIPIDSHLPTGIKTNTFPRESKLTSHIFDLTGMGFVEMSTLETDQMAF